MVKGITKNRIEKEKKTIEKMIQMYCKKFHSHENRFCQSCLKLFEYAENRLNFCQFGENKPICNNCPIHCYKTDMREKVLKIMRYVGPRMICSHPIMSFRHLVNKFKKTQNLDVREN